MPFMLPFLLQTAPESPRSPPAPPMATPYMAPRISTAPAERFTVDVEVRGSSEILWSGPLRVATNQSTSIRRDRSEPAATPCPDEGYVGGSEQTNLSVQLNAQRTREDATLVRVTVRWARPAPGRCGSRGSARTVELNDTVELPRGEWVTLRGDGNLELRLRRQ
ncbi:hypothetical protein IAG41_05190 [Sphingomonas sp. JC676]|uniref:hypothetical protein n=1 Tax=Sphingomonas sp. JC676 TaxID=2768065 RepID=UPI0016586D60|nr:hypothetical protein [Sphingomonas sp. JC676]MBC9031780.1 hypothetical protein [Sphingomonas sp. JC676]